MSYQVLARKYRPRTFDAMVGQEHVLRALVNGLEHDRLHHAYLFTGTRGVGKTTLARILAKCLNCETGVGSKACDECSACREIDEGRFVDLIEVDAASRTRVEDTRELLDNVQYAPSRGRYKIYLVDEVHMLSGHSFNALLKTLEEPPDHVKFLLATTDPQKMPVTILSRCLQFNLKRLPAEQITDHLGSVLRDEGLEVESRALQRLALAADGSMRDALSLTDQALAFGAGQITDDDVRAMLGAIQDDTIVALLEALAARDGVALMATVETLAERAPDFDEVLAELLGRFHRISLLQTVPDAVARNHPDDAALAQVAERLPPEDVQLFYQIGINGRRDLPLAPEPRMGLEMVLLRMLAFQPDDAPVPPSGGGGARSKGGDSGAGDRQGPPAESPEPATEHPGMHAVDGDGSSQAAAVPFGATATSAETPVAEATTAAPEPEVAAVDVEEARPAASSGTPLPPWHELIAELELTGMARALAMQCTWGGFDHGVVRLYLASAHELLRSRELESRIETALEARLGRPLRLDVQVGESGSSDTISPAQRAEEARQQRQRAAEEAIEADPTVADLRSRFGAEVVPDTIEPVDPSESDNRVRTST